jgi:hypothetical protein
MESQRALVENLMCTELKIRETIHVRLPVTLVQNLRDACVTITSLGRTCRLIAFLATEKVVVGHGVTQLDDLYAYLNSQVRSLDHGFAEGWTVSIMGASARPLSDHSCPAQGFSSLS